MAAPAVELEQRHIRLRGFVAGRRLAESMATALDSLHHLEQMGGHTATELLTRFIRRGHEVLGEATTGQQRVITRPARAAEPDADTAKIQAKAQRHVRSELRAYAWAERFQWASSKLARLGLGKYCVDKAETLRARALSKTLRHVGAFALRRDQADKRHYDLDRRMIRLRPTKTHRSTAYVQLRVVDRSHALKVEVAAARAQETQRGLQTYMAARREQLDTVAGRGRQVGATQEIRTAQVRGILRPNQSR
jgi:hypothetical protein